MLKSIVFLKKGFLDERKSDILHVPGKFTFSMYVI